MMMINKKKILVSGASIAGPALAYWLNRYGFQVTVVERSPQLREGGYKIDVRGAAIEVIRQMGIYKEVFNASCDMIGATFINEKGKKIVDMPADLIGMREKEDVELMRGDLSKILYDLTFGDCEYIFDDSIISIGDVEEGVCVRFENNNSRTFDFVIGADGIHSNVRNIVFGDEANFTHSFGDYYFAIYSVPNKFGLDRRELFYGGANRAVNVYSTKNSKDAKALLAFRCPDFIYKRKDPDLLKTQLAAIFGDMKWEVPGLLQSAGTATDFYFDAVKQIRMKAWAKNRVALVGDAAYGPSWASGQGTSMALVGAYILAGELFAGSANYAAAFNRYQQAMLSFVEKNQQLGESVHDMIPKSCFALWFQMQMIKLMPYLPGSGAIVKKMKGKVKSAANAVELKDYERALTTVI